MSNSRLISSRNNPQFKRWVSLLESDGSKSHQQCLVAGTKIWRDLLQYSHSQEYELLLPPTYNISNALDSQLTSITLTKPLFQELDVFGTREPLLVAPIPILPSFDLSQPPHGLEILCPIGDPGNLGALLRSCRAFGVGTVILLRESVHPFHPKVIRASSGAVFVQALGQGCSINELHNAELLKWIIPLDLEGHDIFSLDWPQHIRLLVGEEGAGIPSLPFSRRFTIPQIHTEIPLNATVAASLAIHAYRHQHPLS